MARTSTVGRGPTTPPAARVADGLTDHAPAGRGS